MRQQKIIVRKQKRTHRQYVFWGIGIGSIACVLIGFLVVRFFLIHPDLYVSPLPKTVLSRTFDVDAKTIIAKGLKTNNISYSEIVVTPDSFYVVKITDGGEVWLSSEKDLTAQLATLQVIVTRLTMEGKQFKKLDLRFDKPVIVL